MVIFPYSKGDKNSGDESLVDRFKGGRNPRAQKLPDIRARFHFFLGVLLSQRRLPLRGNVGLRKDLRAGALEAMQFEGLIRGRLLRRYKRFLADVEMADGRVITVHCPNTGAMTGCAVPGSPVWLSSSAVKTRKYPHTWELVETASGMACIHSSRANQVVREAFAEGLIPGFEDYDDISSEVKYGRGSRVDLLLQGPGRRVFVEVKSVTLCRAGGQGVFPDAVSERGRKHLRELQSVLAGDTRAVLFFCVFHAGVKAVCAAADIDPAYRDTLAQAMAAGVEVLAWGADISTSGISLARALPFALDPYIAPQSR